MASKTIQFPIVLTTNDDEQPQETSLDLVPDDTLEEILFLVPVKTVLWCKTLSKPWLRMLDNPVFARNHFSRAPICPLLVFRDKSSCRSSRIMYLVEGQSVSDLDPDISKSKLISRFDFDTDQDGGHSSIRHRFLPVNMKAISCEGVVCWILHDHRDGHYIFICNPVTGEYVSESPLPMDEDNVYAFIGIGFSRVTKKFELLRMSAKPEYGAVSQWWPEVRTLGDSRWRRVGDGTIELNFFREIWQVVYVNGAIYWSYRKDSKIYSFHFDRVIFQVIPPPQMVLLMLRTNNFALDNISVGVLADSLCVSLVSSNDGHVELWILKNDGVSEVKWNKLYDIETMSTYFEHSGILRPRGQYKVIKYLQRGEILMHDYRGKFITYDPVTKDERHYCVLGDSCLEDLRKDRFGDMQVVPHVPCLMKLKEALNMDEKEVKVIKREPVV